MCSFAHMCARLTCVQALMRVQVARVGEPLVAVRARVRLHAEVRVRVRAQVVRGGELPAAQAAEPAARRRARVAARVRRQLGRALAPRAAPRAREEVLGTRGDTWRRRDHDALSTRPLHIARVSER